MNKSLIAGLFVTMATLAGVHYMGQTSTTPDFKQLFEQWKSTHAQEFQVAEDIYRFLVFVENYVRIQEHNANSSNNYKLGLNQFAAMTNDEFKSLQLGSITPRTEYNPVQINIERPASVNWQTAGAVTPIKNQGQCGSCWAFSTTGSLEGLNFIKNGNLLSFSEQQLVDCSQSFGNQGCNGGLMDNAFKYVEKYGIETESDYPYTAQTGTCHYSASKVAFNITGYTDVVSNSTDQLLNAAAGQPVSVAIEADSFQFQMYSTGIFDYSGCGTSLDHGVLVFGYGSTNGKQWYWLKNSWGTTWGQSGVMQIAAVDGPGICGIQMEPSFPTV